MKRYQRWITLVLALMILGIASVAVAAIAASGLPWESSGEPGALPSAFTRPSAVVDAPDEGNGYIRAPAAPASDVSGSTDAPVLNENRNATTTDLRPDDNGYAGDLPATTNSDIPSSENADALTPPDWSTFLTEPQVDDNVTFGASLKKHEIPLCYR